MSENCKSTGFTGRTKRREDGIRFENEIISRRETEIRFLISSSLSNAFFFIHLLHLPRLTFET